MRNLTFITLTQGNPIALKATVENIIEWFDGRVNQVIIGDMCIFQDDKDLIKSYDFGVETHIINLDFNYLFLNGFGATLNHLAHYFPKNDLCLYMNVGEQIESFLRLSEFDNDNYNCFEFDHATETHKWKRLWNRNDLRWSGRIHEELRGKFKLGGKILFRMADTEKDNTNLYKTAIYNDIKELVYFNQYLIIAKNPLEIQATNQGWVDYAKRDYNYILERMNKKGLRLEAFKTGDLNMYLSNCQYFEPNGNTDLIVYQ